MMQYTHEMFENDIPKIIENLESNKNKDARIHLVVPMYGGLTIANKLRNKMGYPISLVKMSTYADKDNRDEEATWIHKNGIKVSDELIIIDDLWDSGYTFQQCMHLVQESYTNNKVRAVSLHAPKEVPEWLYSVNPHPGEWITYCTWE